MSKALKRIVLRPYTPTPRPEEDIEIERDFHYVSWDEEWIAFAKGAVRL